MQKLRSSQVSISMNSSTEVSETVFPCDYRYASLDFCVLFTLKRSSASKFALKQVT